MKNWSIILVFVVLGVGIAQADVIYLKNGQKVQGKIIQESGNSYKIEVSGNPVTYYQFEIDKVVKGDEPQTPLVVEQKNETPPAAAAPAIGKTEPLPLAAQPEAPEPVFDLTASLVEPVSPAKQELINKLLDVNGSRQYMAQLFSQIVSQAPDNEQGKIQDILQVDEVIKKIIPIYGKYYSEEDLKEIIQFYSSPIGRKHLDNTPKVMEDTMREVGKYFQDKAAAAGLDFTE